MIPPRLTTGSAPPDVLLRCVHGAWDHRVEPLRLPDGLGLVMGDVNCGAHTPSMVKKVVAWRQADEMAGALWGEYAAASESLQLALTELCDTCRLAGAGALRR